MDEIVTLEPVILVPYIKIQFAMNSKKPLNRSGFLFSYNPKNKNGCYYTTTSKKLSEDVCFILRSLGCYVSITEGVGKYKKDGKIVVCKKYYELYIKSRQSDKLFRLERKKDYRKPINISKRITNITIDGVVKGRCITVSNPNGLYITDDFIVTHNSYLCVNLIFGDAFIYPNTRYFIARKTLKDLVSYTTGTIHKVFEDWDMEAEYYIEEKGTGIVIEEGFVNKGIY